MQILVPGRGAIFRAHGTKPFVKPLAKTVSAARATFSASAISAGEWPTSRISITTSS
jgi:hypothetical protein